MSNALRRAHSGDVARLYDIDQAASAHPWTYNQFIDCCRGEKEQVWLAERGGRTAGFIVLAKVLDEAGIYSIAVDPQYQRMGVARQLLEGSTEVMKQLGVSKLTLEVRESNVAARALYTGLGFVPDGRRKAYYPAAVGREDALLMSKIL